MHKVSNIQTYLEVIDKYLCLPVINSIISIFINTGQNSIEEDCNHEECFSSEDELHQVARLINYIIVYS